jgi:hypothetical protein
MAVYTKNMVALCLGSLVLMATLISSQAGEGVYGTHARTPLSVSIMIKLNNEEFHRDYYVVKICDIFFLDAVGCFEPHQNCFPDDCQKHCEEGLGKDVTGTCQLDKILNPYNQFACCCYRNSP